jgi:hypothetical protein
VQRDIVQLHRHPGQARPRRRGGYHAALHRRRLARPPAILGRFFRTASWRLSSQRQISPHTGSIDLPYIDEHAITIAVPRDLVWTALRRYAATSIGFPGGNPLARVLGTAPRSGFEVAEAVPPDKLTLAGRHRFSRYALAFELHDTADDSTVLRATTYAEFPGSRGQIYRLLVIGTRVHVLATSHMLRTVQRLSSRATSP